MEPVDPGTGAELCLNGGDKTARSTPGDDAMSDAGILELAMQSLILMLQLSLPPILVASLAGLIVSLIQAVTQLQEQTLAFGVKLVAVSVTILLLAGWLGGELYRFADMIFTRFAFMAP
jgi:type III secretion protein S